MFLAHIASFHIHPHEVALFVVAAGLAYATLRLLRRVSGS